MATPTKKDITFSAASTAGLNNPGTEIVTLVKDGSGNFINPPSYDKMRAYLRGGDVPMLFVTDEGSETGSLYQLVEYSEPENKIRFSNDKTTIEFSAGAASPVVSDVVPKPLTYDYMPEGYPTKAMGTVTVMAEQEVAFAYEGGATPGESPAYGNHPALKIVEGKTYAVKWDGTEYECVCSADATALFFGNTSILGGADDTGEPFAYYYDYDKGESYFATLDTAATHTISVKTIAETVTPIAAEFLPSEINELIMNSSTTGSTKKFKITVDDNGTISATEVP